MDKLQQLGNALIQHGKYNDRVYIMKVTHEDLPGLFRHVDHLCAVNGYSKLVAKVPAGLKEDFQKQGYMAEACIPAFYQGIEDLYFMSKFLDKERKLLPDKDKCSQVLELCQQQDTTKELELPPGFEAGVAQPDIIPDMANIYKAVFATYPFPIFKRDYLLETMQDNVVYFYVAADGQLISLASSEMDPEGENVEMTDFATLPQYRGKGCAGYLLWQMEEHMAKQGIQKAYTIARAISPGMNITFAKLGYHYAGNLVNNTNISGRLETMNIWHKTIN